MKKLLWIVLLFTAMLEIKAQTNIYSLDFDPEKYSVQTFTFDEKEYKVRAYENIVYVENPIDTTYQKINIYVREEYFSDQKINGFDKETAPVFLPNGVGGYMPSQPLTLNRSNRNIFGIEQRGQRQMPPQAPQGDTKQGSAIHYALARGFVVASPGARGRSVKNSAGVYTGKAPAGLVDLKAAISYLRYNDKIIPGDKSKIISNGTSAGGAMSTLLGATGNNGDYKPYLEEIGAADMPDDIFAVSAYCPITDLDHADCAYEWQFNGVNTYEPMMFDMISGIKPEKNSSNLLTELQIKTSDQLKLLFPVYLNSLNLKTPEGKLLTLDEDGNGTFKDFVIYYVLTSAQTAIDQGKDLSGIEWLNVEDGKAIGLDFEAYVKNMKRMKTPPAFDAFDMTAPENQLFGTYSVNAQHFTQFSYKNSPDKGTLANSEIIKMMNPLYYIGTKNNTTSPYWHIRYGTIDNNTSLAIEVIIATILKNKGYEVDFQLAWDRPHMGDYDLDELFDWIEKIIK